MAYELINFREQVQTQLQAEQKKAVAAVRGEPPATPNAQPVAPVAGPVAAPQAVEANGVMIMATIFKTAHAAAQPERYHDSNERRV